MNGWIFRHVKTVVLNPMYTENIKVTWRIRGNS
jgi:hypothetical protein